MIHTGLGTNFQDPESLPHTGLRIYDPGLGTNFQDPESLTHMIYSYDPVLGTNFQDPPWISCKHMKQVSNQLPRS